MKSTIEVMEKYFYDVLRWEKEYVDLFIAPSKFMKEKLVDHGIPAKKIIHLPYFVYKHNETMNPESIHARDRYMLYFGRLSPEKGIQDLLMALNSLLQVKLIIAGQGPYESELRRINHELGNKNVKFVGFQKDVHLHKLIDNSSFTVLPSKWYEVFGLSILESFTHGKPVIAANIGGIPDIVKHGSNGLLFESGNIDSLEITIMKLWNNQKLVDEMGNSAKKHAENFSSDIHYRKIVEIYHKFQ